MRLKKYLLIMALLMAFVGLLGVSCGGDEEPAIPHSDIVCFGNSLTSGMSATTKGVDDPDHAYPAYLKDKLIASVTVYNAGVSGSMTGFDIPIGPIPSGVSRVGDVLDRTPYCVVVELGANDLLLPFEYADLSKWLYGYYPPTIDDITEKIIPDTKDNLNTILDKLRGIEQVYLVKFYTDGTDGTPDVVSGIFSYLGLDPDTGQKDAIVSAYNDMFDDLYEEYKNNVELISDIWSGVWNGDGTMSADGIHPTAKGYAVQADLYFKVMKPYLESNGWVKSK